MNNEDERWEGRWMGRPVREKETRVVVSGDRDREAGITSVEGKGKSEKGRGEERKPELFIVGRQGFKNTMRKDVRP